MRITPGGVSYMHRSYTHEIDTEAPKCPQDVSAWDYWSISLGFPVFDPSLKVSCAAGKGK